MLCGGLSGRVAGRVCYRPRGRPPDRRLYLAPPFLVSDSDPAAVVTARAGGLAEKVERARAELADCRACPRDCRVNRQVETT